MSGYAGRHDAAPRGSARRNGAPSRPARRVGGVAGVAAGTLYAAVGIADLFAPRAHWPGPVLLASASDYLDQLFLVAALVGTLVAIAGLCSCAGRRRRSNGRAAWAVGSLAAFFGHALLLYDASQTAAREAAPAASSGSVAVEWGSLLALVGLVLLGTATLGTRALPRWCGLALVVSGLPFLVLPGDPSWWGGWVLLGGAWGSVGFALSWGAGTPAGRKARGRRAPKNAPNSRRPRRGAGPPHRVRGTAARRPRLRPGGDRTPDLKRLAASGISR